MTAVTFIDKYYSCNIYHFSWVQTIIFIIFVSVSFVGPVGLQSSQFGSCEVNCANQLILRLLRF